jgi:hypothetical protein
MRNLYQNREVCNNAFTKIIVLICFLTCTIFGCKNDTLPQTPPSINNDNNIILYLVYDIPFVPRDNKESVFYYFIPILIIWNDGRILIGQNKEGSNYGDLSSWNYFLSTIDMSLVREKQSYIISSFNLGNNDTCILDRGFDCPYFCLYSNYKNRIIEIQTWEHFENDTYVSDQIVIISTENTIPLHKFHNTWKKVKADIITLENIATLKRNVHIDIDHNTVSISTPNFGNEKNILLQFDLPAHK